MALGSYLDLALYQTASADKPGIAKIKKRVQVDIARTGVSETIYSHSRWRRDRISYNLSRYMISKSRDDK